MPFFGDEGSAWVVIPVNAEMWTAIHAPNLDPVAEIQRRGLDRLRLNYGYEEDEIEVVSGDALYANACREEYWKAKKRFDKHRKIPRHFKVEFQRPGTRKPNNREVPGEKEK